MPQRQDLSAAWAALPQALRARLSLASTGWRRLAGAGSLCLELSRQAPDVGERARLAALAADMLLWAWGENPLAGPLAAEVLAAHDLPLPDAARACLAAVAEAWRPPEGPEGSHGKGGGLAYFESLAKKRDVPRLAEFLAGQVARAPRGLFWRDKALALSLYAAEQEQRARLTAVALDGLSDCPGLAPVAGVLAAQAAFLRGDAGACLDGMAELGGVFGPAFAPARSGLALLAAGEDARALALLLEALAAAPWQASLALTAADAVDDGGGGARRELAPPPGPALIMLYTWNKAADLDATLASLAASDLSAEGGGARLLVLDNGSTDDTPQVLEAWAARLGDRLSRLTLPVNIGAPAARNWLAATPEARAAETLVFLDDDVDLPPDWLSRLGAALRRNPDAGVVGCKVADHHAPHLLQNVAGHLVIPPDAAEDRPDFDFQSLSPNPFRLLDTHLQGPDWGLFDHIGPCASVTGCCHLFRRSWLDLPASAGGGFSLALGPSQYDDFERDLRMLAGGGFAAYTGHLRVRHRKRSGLASQQANAEDNAGANAAGNRYKMQCLHDRQEIEAFINAQGERQEAFLRARLALLGEHRNTSAGARP